MSKAITDITAERERQKAVEGWTEEHDDEHDQGEMVDAAMAYCFSANGEPENGVEIWPWSAKWWKPKDPRRDLVRAATLLVAEIERMDRIQEAP